MIFVVPWNSRFLLKIENIKNFEMYSKRDLNNEARRQYSQKLSRRESGFSEYIYSKRGISDWNEGWKFVVIP